MNNQGTTKTTLELAKEHHFIANEELCKPEEDLMPYKVCRSSYKAVGNYLAAFLESKGVEVKDEMSLEYLFNACRGLEPRFDELNLELLYYGNDHDVETIWADDKLMHDYLDLADKTKALFDKVQ